METLTWRLVGGTDCSSRAIAWFGGGLYSHIDFRESDGSYTGARADRIGGQPPGYFTRPADYIPARKLLRTLFLTLSVTAEQARAFRIASNLKLHAPYDRSAIWGFLLGRNWRDPGSWECAEAQADSCEKAGIFAPLILSTNKITPNDMALLLSALGAKANA
jgi:hypothetical protein